MADRHFGMENRQGWWKSGKFILAPIAEIQKTWMLQLDQVSLPQQ
jgi:hypothetical protein